MGALAEEWLESRQNFSKIYEQVKLYEDAMKLKESELKQCKMELRQTQQSLENEQLQNKRLDMQAKQHELLWKEIGMYKQAFASLTLANGLTGEEIMRMSRVGTIHEVHAGDISDTAADAEQELPMLKREARKVQRSAVPPASSAPRTASTGMSPSFAPPPRKIVATIATHDEAEEIMQYKAQVPAINRPCSPVANESPDWNAEMSSEISSALEYIQRLAKFHKTAGALGGSETVGDKNGCQFAQDASASSSVYSSSSTTK